MKRVFKLRCDGIGPIHTKFTLFDASHANCGTIVVATQDMENLIYHSWNGRVDWNGKPRLQPLKEAGSAESESSNPAS
jgi:hypothetical protein